MARDGIMKPLGWMGQVAGLFLAALLLTGAAPAAAEEGRPAESTGLSMDELEPLPEPEITGLDSEGERLEAESSYTESL